jgi:RNA polymerase sigma factor (sigma-70 family)
LAQASYTNALRQLDELFNVGTIGGLTDGELLDRFTSCDDEAAELAFAALVERHGPMVLRVCQSVLRQRHDAEDAFQATFLILVRNAASIRKQNSVVSWLHGVAVRTALCQKGAAVRRRRHEQSAGERPVAFVDQLDQEELSAVLHEELDRLPQKYRAPIVLCYLESLSHEQAASQLCWPVGTVRSRLARGREQLRGRLARRGLAPSIFMLNRTLCGESARAAIRPELASTTAHAAMHYSATKSLATGVASRSVALLVEGAMNAMFLSKIKLALLACGLIATGTLVVAQHVGTARPDKGTQSTNSGAVENRPMRSGPLDENAAVAEELRQLDLELLAQDVRDLREQVEVALRDKLRAERVSSGDTSAAKRAYEEARSVYLVQARELRVAQRRLLHANEPREPGRNLPGVQPPPNDEHVFVPPSSHPGGGQPSAAAIGSLNLEAVFKRSEKVQATHKEHNAANLSRKNELAIMLSDIRAEIQILSKLTPGSVDHNRHEARATDLKARYEAAREQVERESTRQSAGALATVYTEIQDTVAALAKDKGLTYVVKVAPAPRTDSEHSEISSAVNNSVVYADPRNDLTEEVIAELNRRFHASGAKPSR